MVEDEARLGLFGLWLLLMAVGVVVGGLGLALFPSSPAVHFLVNRPIDPSFFSGGEASAAALRYREWVFGVLGASLMGWGGLMAWVVWRPFRSGEPWAWHALAWTLLAWYVLDTGISIRHGVAYNALLNTLLLLGFALPLAATRSCFRRRALRE